MQKGVQEAAERVNIGGEEDAAGMSPAERKKKKDGRDFSMDGLFPVNSLINDWVRPGSSTEVEVDPEDSKCPRSWKEGKHPTVFQDPLAKLAFS